VRLHLLDLYVSVHSQKNREMFRRLQQHFPKAPTVNFTDLSKLRLSKTVFQIILGNSAARRWVTAYSFRNYVMGPIARRVKCNETLERQALDTSCYRRRVPRGTWIKPRGISEKIYMEDMHMWHDTLVLKLTGYTSGIPDLLVHCVQGGLGKRLGALWSAGDAAMPILVNKWR
jgi:hypothetical protein